MSVFNIKLADTVIGIETVHVLPYALSRQFFTDERPDIRIISTQADIDSEKPLFEAENGLTASWDGAVEVTVILRKVAESIIDYGAFVIHGAAIAVNDEAYLFTANSGVGKTTHTMKWLENVPGAYAVNGDKPLVLTGDMPMVCGSPWAGKEGLYTNKMVPLKAIIVLERSEENEIHRIPFAEAFPALFQQIHRPEEIEKMRKSLSLLKTLDGKVDCYSFKMNNFKDNSLQVSYEALTGKKL